MWPLSSFSPYLFYIYPGSARMGYLGPPLAGQVPEAALPPFSGAVVWLSPDYSWSFCLSGEAPHRTLTVHVHGQQSLYETPYCPRMHGSGVDVATFAAVINQIRARFGAFNCLSLVACFLGYGGERSFAARLSAAMPGFTVLAATGPVYTLPMQSLAVGWAQRPEWRQALPVGVDKAITRAVLLGGTLLCANSGGRFFEEGVVWETYRAGRRTAPGEIGAASAPTLPARPFAGAMEYFGRGGAAQFG